MRQARCRFSVIVETFEHSGPPGAALRAAPIERVLRQISAAQPFARRPLTAFSIPDYMDPAAGAGGLSLARGYAAAFGLKAASELLSNREQSLR